MMNYPKHCTPLAEEELEYTTGGANALLVGGLLTSVVVTLGMIPYNTDLNNQMKRENPDKYDDSLAGQTELSKDVRKEFFKHPQGWLLAVGYVLALGCVFIGSAQEASANAPTYPVYYQTGTI